jgi:hypothetical protein
LAMLEPHAPTDRFTASAVTTVTASAPLPSPKEEALYPVIPYWVGRPVFAGFNTLEVFLLWARPSPLASTFVFLQ